MIDKCKYCGGQIHNEHYLTKNGKQCKGCDLDYRYEVENKPKLKLRDLTIKNKKCAVIKINPVDIIRYDFSLEKITIKTKKEVIILDRKDFLYIHWDSFRIKLLTFFEEEIK